MDIYQFWFQHYRRGKVVDKLPQGKVNHLKAQIRHRLNTEDYTCRLPKDPPKPRYRYKLRLRQQLFCWGSYGTPINVWVYK